MRKCRIGTAKFFTLLLLLYRTSVDAQGMNRMERCTNYFWQCKAKAEELKVPFRWKLETVEGAAHQGVKMAEGAAAYIFGKSSEDRNRRV